MKRLIIILALVFSFSLIGKTQITTDTSFAIDSLSNKVNELEHNLNYLKLTYELNILRAELNIAASEANIKSLEMKMDVYHSSKFDIDLYNSYRDWNQMAVSQKESFAGLIEAKKKLVAISLLTAEFSEDETNLLIQTCGVIDNAFNSYGAALDMVQKILDVWKKMY